MLVYYVPETGHYFQRPVAAPKWRARSISPLDTARRGCCGFHTVSPPRHTLTANGHQDTMYFLTRYTKRQRYRCAFCIFVNCIAELSARKGIHGLYLNYSLAVQLQYIFLNTGVYNITHYC